MAGPARVCRRAGAGEDAEKARQLFQQGSKYYDLGQFDKAIEAWQHGYDQKPDPGFLYNIAQAYRQKQDAAKAIFFYKGYLRNSPKAHNRAEVEQKIAALQKQLDAGAPPRRHDDAAARTRRRRRPPNTDTAAATNTPPPTATHPTAPPPAAAPSVVQRPPPPPLHRHAADGGRADARRRLTAAQRRAHRRPWPRIGPASGRRA